VYISLVADMFHMFEELIEGEEQIGASGDGAMKLRVKPLVLVADVLSQVIFSRAHFAAGYGTASDERFLVSRYRVEQ
jgi:hypothetical protein